MKLFMILTLSSLVACFAGCNNESELDEEVPQEYLTAIRDWKGKIEPSAPVDDVGAQLKVNFFYLENHPYVKERPAYVCLAIDGRVIFDAKVNNPRSGDLVIDMGKSKDLLVDFPIGKGKHIIDVFDVAHGLKIRREIEIEKDGCWIAISSQPDGISISIHDSRPLLA